MTEAANATYSPDQTSSGIECAEIHGAVVGRLIGIRESGQPIVDFPGNTQPVAIDARTTVPVLEGHVGSEIVLLFDEGDPTRPILTGILEAAGSAAARPVEIKNDRKRSASGAIKDEASETVSGVVIGLLGGFGDNGEALVDFPENTKGALIPAKIAAPASTRDIGREAALMFEAGNPAKPILIGFLDRPVKGTAAMHTRSYDEVLRLEARERIVIGCGDASITLTRAGKVIIRGKYVSSNSSGANLIKGGVIRLN